MTLISLSEVTFDLSIKMCQVVSWQDSGSLKPGLFPEAALVSIKTKYIKQLFKELSLAAAICYVVRFEYVRIEPHV